MRAIEAHDGILLVNKPAGPTSHDIVDKIRNQFNFKKVGHGGTLDPGETGLLMLLIGKGTKLSNTIMGADKTYEGSIRLGASTNTQDADGEIIKEADYSFVTKEILEEQMEKYTGDLFQTPPMVSAVKVNGVPLYKSARKGKEIEREPRFIHIYLFKLLEFNLPDASFIVKCTKGTYIRTLCSDIGDDLGCGAHMLALHRTQCGSFDVKDAVDGNELLKLDRSEVISKIIPLDKLPSNY